MKLAEGWKKNKNVLCVTSDAQCLLSLLLLFCPSRAFREDGSPLLLLLPPDRVRRPRLNVASSRLHTWWQRGRPQWEDTDSVSHCLLSSCVNELSQLFVPARGKRTRRRLPDVPACSWRAGWPRRGGSWGLGVRCPADSTDSTWFWTDPG